MYLFSMFLLKFEEKFMTVGIGTPFLVKMSKIFMISFLPLVFNSLYSVHFHNFSVTAF